MRWLSTAEELGSYFQEGAYGFEIRFGRGTFADFYAATPRNDLILAQRRALLETHPERHVQAVPNARGYLEEFAGMAVEAGILRSGTEPENLGRELEPDFLILRDRRLVYGCVCFPSSWSLAEKIGKPLEEIHLVVPGLNTAIGGQIGRFLDRLKPGVSWTRSNWGVSRHADYNQHPALGLSRLDERVALEEVYFRVEEQSLLALPETGGVLFGIRIKVFPLRVLIESGAGKRLERALETMPEEMARYKGIAAARGRIAELLRAGAEDDDGNGSEKDF